MSPDIAPSSSFAQAIEDDDGGLTLVLPFAPDMPGDGLRLWGQWAEHMHRHALDATLACLRSCVAGGEYPEEGLSVRWRLFGSSLDALNGIGTAITLRTGSGEEIRYGDGGPALKGVFETLEHFPTDVAFLDGLNNVFGDRVIKPNELDGLEETLLGREWVATRAARCQFQSLSADLPQGRPSRPLRV